MKLLIIVDYQNDFVTGSLGFPKAVSLEKGICELIKNFDGEVVYTLDTHDENYLNTHEGKMLPVKHCIKGTKGHEIYGDVKRLLDGKRCFEKNTFPSGELYEYIKGREYTRIELAGLVSNICVISNAVMAKAACPEAYIVVHSSLTSCADNEMNEKALDVMRGLQINVI